MGRAYGNKRYASCEWGKVIPVLDAIVQGQATEVTVLTDPGHGFEAAAQACALRQKYQTARDSDGRAVAGETKPFRVRFER